MKKYRKRTVREDCKIYPTFIFEDYEIKPINLEHQIVPYGYTGHHFIRTQFLDNHLDIAEQLLKYQKIIFVPTFGHDMHSEIHSRHSKFKENWGVELSEVIFDEDNYKDYLEEE